MNLSLLFLIHAWAGPATAQLPELPGLHDRWDAGRAWGTPLLVDTLLGSLEQIAWDHPNWDPITVGDISRRGGGPMFGHKTHNKGIDADLSLFIQGGRTLDGFENLRSSQIDVAANWTLIESLLESGNVAFILLEQRHINRIALYLERERGWSREEIRGVMLRSGEWAPWSERGLLRHAPNHASHLHVRITPPPPPRPTN